VPDVPLAVPEAGMLPDATRIIQLQSGRIPANSELFPNYRKLINYVSIDGDSFEMQGVFLHVYNLE
jgi:hypothetical protein